MSKSVNTTETILATKSIFTTTIEACTKESDWEKDINTGAWVRQRKYRASRVVPALVQLVVPPQNTAPEWLGPTFVIGEGDGTAAQRLSLTQREVRERMPFSKKLGQLVHKSWHLKVRSELQDIPTIVTRELTPQEREEHRQFGGSGALSTIADLEPPVDLILGYEESWYLREGAELAPRMDPGGQIGQLVLASLHQTSARLLQNGA